jgi:hypothetical protein
MTTTVVTLLLVAAYLPSLLVVHLLLCRWSGIGRIRYPAQGSALRAGMITTALMVGVTGFLTWGEDDCFPAAIYCGMSCWALSCSYFVMFCITESGRRYRLVKLLLEHGEMNEQDLRVRYSPKYMIDQRLERLLKWKALELQGGRLLIGKRLPLWGTRFFFAWSRVLGMPWPGTESSSDPLTEAATIDSNSLTNLSASRMRQPCSRADAGAASGLSVPEHGEPRP